MTSLSGKTGSRQATSPDLAMQALAVYAGQRCLGHILPRGKSGIEAFDQDDKSLGIFPTQKLAADAVSNASRVPADAVENFEAKLARQQSRAHREIIRMLRGGR